MGGNKDPEPQISQEATKKTENVKTDMLSKTSVDAPFWVDKAWRGGVSDFQNTADQFGDTVDQFGSAVGQFGFGAPDQLQQAWDMAQGVAQGDDPFNAFETSLGYFADEAAGKNLFGGQGFNEAVQAAGDFSAQNVLNTFIESGRAGGGLAQAAITKAYTDPFALQYDQNRARQQQAAQLLPGMSLMPASVMEGIGQSMDARTLQDLNLQAQQAGLQSQEAGLYSQIPGMLAPWLERTQEVSGKNITNITGSTAGEIQPAYQPGSQVGNAIGGGIAGAGVGATFGPIGALTGGLLGAGSSFL